MSNYKGYLKGINPNNTRKLIMDEQSFAYEPATGTFVNGIGEEVKTMKEAIAKNEKLDTELKGLFPPQKAVGAKPVSRHVIHKQIASKQKRMTPSKSFQQIKNTEKKLGNVNTIGSDVFFNLKKPVDEYLQMRKELDRSSEESKAAEKRFKQLQFKFDEDKGKGLAGILGVDDA